MKNKETALGLEYWLQWQVLVSALILLLTTVVSVLLLRKRGSEERGSLKPADLWTPCWRNLHPRWLLFYRAFAFIAMAYLLYQTVAAFGFFVFFFYTQHERRGVEKLGDFCIGHGLLCMQLATIVSIRGCRIYARKPLAQTGERDIFIKKDSEDINSGKPSVSKRKKAKDLSKLELPSHPFLLNKLMTSAGAAMLTDLVFWCLLLPFMTGKDFQLTLLIGCMHSVNAVFLILESALNRLPFTWFGLVYFVLWSCAYVFFQWVLHACCFTWWPYPFFDLSTPWAPLWYLALGLVHIPCYGLYVLLKKAKNAAFSRIFPRKFVRSN
ncbi:hypothetical protein Sango_0270200 [Sesamum angolense]|uniref:Uncharacterized protein n=1 Tax=Sesamum angolense TaxID=2727404 RepID=A0AAE2C2Q1_9LAMI|nr:hypothetical protein Sango_0270200 [Sesamum angolense]